MSATEKPDGTVPCPACGKAVDPLRAGQVAILDGRFHYFCDAKCKASYLARGERPIVSDDVATAAPPEVGPRAPAATPRSQRAAEPARFPASRRARPVEVSVSDERARDPSEPPPRDPSEPPRDSSEPPPRDSSEPPPRDSGEEPERAVTPRDSVRLRRASGADAPIDDEPPPPSSVEVRVAPAAPAEPSPEDEATPWLPLAGATAGLLSVAVRLVAPALDATELPLALAASACALWVAADRPAQDRRAQLPQAVAVALAAGAAAWARARGLPQAPSALALAGVGAACALTVDLVVRRAALVVERARRRIADGMPATARLVQEGGATEVRASDVRAGQQVLVEAGALVPVDGIVAGGEATVTPWPDAQADVSKREGDAVIGGALVVTGTLRVTATWAGADRAWMRPTHSGPNAVDHAAPLVRGARAVAERGAPLAALLAVVAGVATGAPVIETLAAAAAAAMALGAPGPIAAVAVRHARGLLAALKHGAVYKDASAFDRAGQVDVAVACARGTLLLGEPEIVAVEAFGAIDTARLLELVSGAVTGSTHPFAAAVARTARARGVRPENVRNALQAGSGATASLASGERVVVGRRAFLLGEKVSVAVADARATELESQGRSVLLCALGGKLVGLLALQDGIKAGARAAVQRLLDARVEPVLLSGEARETCETIGRALDIEHVRPEVASQDRGAEVRALGGGGHVVAVIGHPARDDAALGAADVSVALGAAGAAPGEWGIALASEDVRDAAFALTIPQHTRERARVALAVGLAPAIFGALLVSVAGVSWVVAPALALAGSVAAVLYAKE